MADEKKGITVKIDAGLHAEIRQYIEQNGMTMAEFVSQALYNELHPKIQPQEVKNMGPTRTMAFQMPEDMFQKLKDYLHRHNITQKQFVLGLVEAELNRDQELRNAQNAVAEPEKSEDIAEELDEDESEDFDDEDFDEEEDEEEEEEEEFDDEESEDEDFDEDEDELEAHDVEESEDEDEDANEDIKAADGSVIPKDGLITIVTLSEGLRQVISNRLPFAQYYVQEIATDEHYMLNGEKHLVSFQYMGQEMTTVSIDCDMFLNTLKRGSVSGKKVNEKDELLEKAVFGLFAADTTEFTAEKALLTAESGKDGSFTFNSVPYGEYIVKEIAAPTGYTLSDELYPVTISDDGDVIEVTAVNAPVSVAISKSDIYGKELTGAKMQLIDANGEVVDEWTSDSKEHIVRGLPAGAYTLKEVAAPEGYVIATDISFFVDEYGKVTVNGVEANALTEDGIPCITMVDKAEKKPTVTVPPTGDTGRNVLGLILLVSGLCGVAYAAFQYRKIMKEMHELDTGLAALCPDMIEREEND